MKKFQSKQLATKLTFSRQTVRVLTDAHLDSAVGGWAGSESSDSASIPAGRRVGNLPRRR